MFAGVCERAAEEQVWRRIYTRQQCPLHLNAEATLVLTSCGLIFLRSSKRFLIVIPAVCSKLCLHYVFRTSVHLLPLTAKASVQRLWNRGRSCF